MKFALLLTLSLALSSEALNKISHHNLKRFGKEPFETYSTLDIEDQWIEQKLDHFDPTNSKTWQMRFLENDAYFKEGGPILIFLGGEWTIFSGAITEGEHIVDIAKELGGIMFYTEHRYYGKSRPTPNTSVKNMAFLSIDQALADVAHFIREIKATRPELKDAGVAVVGGSYSATMAAWMRQKYPDLVAGAWASSAPLHAKSNFWEYEEIVGESVALVGGQACYDRIEDAFTKMEEMVKRKDVERINKEFNLCRPLNVSDTINVWSFFSEISSYMSGIVQYHQDPDIQDTCADIMDPQFEDSVAGYAAWIRSFGPSSCLEYEYEGLVEYIRDEDWESEANDGIRQWLYQTCNEFGWYQTSDSPYQPFGTLFPLQLYYNWCKDFYSSEFTPERIEANMRRINFKYGSFQPTASNVYYTHGQLDPWRGMGVEEDVSESAPVAVLPLLSHCADVRAIKPGDAPEVVESKNRVTKLFKQWLRL